MQQAASRSLPLIRRRIDLSRHRLARVMLVTVLGWLVAITVGTILHTFTVLRWFEVLRLHTTWLIVHQIVAWPIGALATGLALRHLYPTVGWYHVLLLALGWTVVGPFGWATGFPAIAMVRVITVRSVLQSPIGPYLISSLSPPRFSYYASHMTGVLNWTWGLWLVGMPVALMLRHALPRLRWS